MGKPAWSNIQASPASICGGGEPGEVKHLSSRRKRKKCSAIFFRNIDISKFRYFDISGILRSKIPLVAASEQGTAQIPHQLFACFAKIDEVGKKLVGEVVGRFRQGYPHTK